MWRSAQYSVYACSLLPLTAIVCSLSPLAVAATSEVDVSTVISGWARSVAWGDRFAVFGTSEWKMEDPSRQLHRRIKSDFKIYLDGDKVESREVTTSYYVQGNQILNGTGQYRRLAIPELAIVDSKEGDQYPRLIEVLRTNQEIKRNFDNQNHDESSGGFLEGRLFDWKLGFVHLLDLFNASKAQLKIRPETNNGRACCVLELDDGADHYAAWLVPEMDYACVRFELSHQNLDRLKTQRVPPPKSSERQCEATNFRQIDGKWIAMSGRIVSTIVFVDGTIATNTLSVERRNVMLDPDFDKLRAFAVNIPDGARVDFSGADLANGVQFEWRQGKIAPQLDEESLRKVLNDLSVVPAVDAASERVAGTGFWFVALGFGAVVIVITLVVLFAKRKRIEHHKAVVPH